MDRINQEHGIWFEDEIRKLNGCYGIPRIKHPFDVPWVYNTAADLDVSVKTVRVPKNSSRKIMVGLASAVRFVAIDRFPYQMIIGLNDLDALGRLYFYEIRTYQIDRDFHHHLTGGVPTEVLAVYDGSIKTLVERRGLQEARDYAIRGRERIQQRFNPIVEIAYKINANNRRAQLAVDLDALQPALIRTDTARYRGKELPWFYPETNVAK